MPTTPSVTSSSRRIWGEPRRQGRCWKLKLQNRLHLAANNVVHRHHAVKERQRACGWWRNAWLDESKLFCTAYRVCLTLEVSDLLKCPTNVLMESTSSLHSAFSGFMSKDIPAVAVATRLRRCGSHHSHLRAFLNATLMLVPVSVTTPALCSMFSSNCSSTLRTHLSTNLPVYFRPNFGCDRKSVIARGCVLIRIYIPVGVQNPTTCGRQATHGQECRHVFDISCAYDQGLSPRYLHQDIFTLPSNGTRLFPHWY